MATLTITPIKVFVSGETVTPTKLNELSQSAVALTAGSIVAADIASDAVTTAKILDANVTTAKLADSAVTTAKINNAAVTAAKLDGAQTGSAPIYGCRAWVNFDGTEGDTIGGEFRCTIRSSGNVSKVVRSATGTFVVHFATAMPNNDYAICGITNQVVLGNRSSGWNIRGTDDSLITTTSVTLDGGSVSAGTAGNNSVVTLCIFG